MLAENKAVMLSALAREPQMLSLQVDFQGQTMLHLAVSHVAPNLVSILMAAGALYSLKDRYHGEKTPRVQWKSGVKKKEYFARRKNRVLKNPVFYIFPFFF